VQILRALEGKGWCSVVVVVHCGLLDVKPRGLRRVRR
jgi:hypothetical protein